MLIRELFEKDVTRDIPPVVYFHERDARRLREEVEEYIVTGGFPKGDPRARRVEHGIHEGFVGLLGAIARELDKPGGPDLPGSWISGFYGSGKSIFAKLLGLALDGAVLDDGTPLADALLRRDDSPRRQELVDAWKALAAKVDPIAVVFDVGAIGRDNEHIHSAALRMLQARLGYCAKSRLVAEWELNLERDGRWQDFLAAAERILGKPWAAAVCDQVAEDHFSSVLHELEPGRYPDPMSWIDAHAGRDTGGKAPAEAIEDMDAMLSSRAPGKTLFFVIDEVSQYVHQDDTRMLKLQSFVSELGKRLRGRAWLLATGQQKLEDSGNRVHIGKLKDRFPEKLRVHLAATNIRDVVHRRLLKTRADREGALRELFRAHRADLKLHGYSCEEITEEDFVEVYPMLPGHVELLLDITTQLRTRSTRVQGDDHAIRGLLQLLGELFRARPQKLADREVGELVTLDAIYEVQRTALDPDVQTALARIATHPSFRDDELAQRVAKAVALLQWIQDTVPTTAELVARCLYARLGQGNRTQAVGEALERLREENLFGYSEKQGYKIQSSAGQEWERERSDVAAPPERRSELVQETLKQLLAGPERPRFKNIPFPWTAFYSDGRSADDLRIQDARTGAAVAVDFRFLASKQDRTPASWMPRSDQDALRDRIIWIVGDPGRIDDVARQLVQSRHMVKRYEGRTGSLPREKERLVFEEQSRVESLERRLRDAVSEAFYDGAIYFRGKQTVPADHGGSFATALTEVGKRWLPILFPFFTDIAVTDTELAQLLEKQLSGPSTKFMEDGLGIISRDAGKYVPTCAGEVPRRIMEAIEGSGAQGSTIFAQFSRPPYGYPADVVKACLAGLLRAGKIRIRPEEGPEITSVQDPGAKDVFRKAKEGLGRADVLPARKTEVGPRDRVAICKLFEEQLDRVLDRENDAIADAVFQLFPGKREALRGVEARLARLPGRPEPPAALTKLGKALEDCTRTRQVLEIVIACKRNLDALRDGLELVGIYQAELTDQAIAAVSAAADVRDHHVAQLRALKELGEVAEAAQRIADHLKAERPWRDVQDLGPALEAVRERYTAARRGLVNAQAQESEAARSRVKRREGFERLDADQSHRVLRPIAEAAFDTTEGALYPDLAELRDRFPGRLAAAEDQANELLDEELSRDTRTEVVRLPASLRGREVTSRAELQALLGELDERIGPLVDQGKRVRIV